VVTEIEGAKGVTLLSKSEWDTLRQSRNAFNLSALEEISEPELLPVETPLEDAVYGEQRPTVVANSVDEFREYAADFNEADALLPIVGTEGWATLKHRASRAYRAAAQAERDYMELDTAKIASLRYERIKAKVVVDWLNQQEAFANDTPKPQLPR
jgi:hypothetical protein